MRRIALLLAVLTIVACGDDDAVTTSRAPDTTTATTLPTTTSSAPEETTTTAAPTTTEAPTTTAESTTTTAAAADPIELRSASFDHEGDIPVEYTCDGANLSPPLEWGDSPPGTVSLALIVDDPDAGDSPWVHWVIFNIPPSVTSLPEGVPGGAANEVLPDGSIQGTNDFGVREIADFNQIGWDGPCPGPNPHRYLFRVFALDTMLDLGSDATATDVAAALGTHVLAESTLAGFYPAAG
jgi:Raf kinase inhibitor-like YbhB/YbcL family protein